MQIKFLDTAQDGLQWMFRYYDRAFTAGRKNGMEKYKGAKQLLRDNPYGGHEFDGMKEVRERNIVKTPFSIIYTVRDDIIYVMDIRDQRGVRPVAGLARFKKK